MVDITIHYVCVWAYFGDFGVRYYVKMGIGLVSPFTRCYVGLFFVPFMCGRGGLLCTCVEVYCNLKGGSWELLSLCGRGKKRLAR